MSQTSPQPGPSTHAIVPQPPLTVQFNTTSPIRTLPLSIIPYPPAQNTQTQNTQPTLTINTLQPNPISNYLTIKNNTRPPLQATPTNPLSYNLTSTNLNTTQHSTLNNHQLNNLNPPSASQTWNTTRNTLQPTSSQSSHSHSTIIRTNPYFHDTYTPPLTNTQNITSNASHTPTYNTIPTSIIPQSTISHPTYINSSTSISEPIKPFDGLDHNYTPEEYLQHIKARVTFSLGLQPSSAREYKFWHARRMAFIQCSLTRTARSWYIRLNDTNKQTRLARFCTSI